MLQVTAAILINETDHILICRRAQGETCEFLWEFPGGKLEENETLKECLIRECKEELGIEIIITGLYAETVYKYPERELAFTFFKAKIIYGDIKLNVHDDVRWVKPEEFSQFEFCPADVEIAERLRALL